MGTSIEMVQPWWAVAFEWLILMAGPALAYVLWRASGMSWLLPSTTGLVVTCLVVMSGWTPLPPIHGLVFYPVGAVVLFGVSWWWDRKVSEREDREESEKEEDRVTQEQRRLERDRAWEEGLPWEVEGAIFDPDTGDVAYVLKGVKLANAIDARIITAAPDALAVAREVVRIFGDYDGADGDIGNLYAEALNTVAKAEGEATTVQTKARWMSEDLDLPTPEPAEPKYLYGPGDQEELSAKTVNEAVETIADNFAPLLDDKETPVTHPETIVIAKFQPMGVDWDVQNPLEILLETLDENFGNEWDSHPQTERMKEAERGFLEVVRSEYRVWQHEEVEGGRVTVNVAEWIRENRPEWRL